MLAAPFCREVHFGNMLASRMQSRVPRCLFGTPNPKDTDELLHESLDADRKRFINRWGVDPCTEDKENYQRNFDRIDSRSPRKNKNLPYSRQTYIHAQLNKNAFDTNENIIGSISEAIGYYAYQEKKIVSLCGIPSSLIASIGGKTGRVTTLENVGPRGASRDYWRSRKNDGNKKSLVSAMDTSKKQQDAQKLMK